MKHIAPLIACWLLIGSYKQGMAQDIYINTDTVVNNQWNLPANAILHFGSKGRINGTGTINGGIIDAALTQWIFDTSLTVNPAGTYGRDFSACWFGAGKFADNYQPLQKGINTVVHNNRTLRQFYIPRGTYRFSKPLKVAFVYKEKYAGAAIHLYGDASFWECCEGTVLEYTGTSGFALGLQHNKGSEINNIIIKGQFKAPVLPDMAYYNLTPEKFKDANGKCDNWYSGLVIDYDPGRNSGGSTGVKVHDVQVSNFAIDYSVSPNGVTFNADILIFENIRCGDARIGFANGQAQEKGNVIRGIYSWGSIHTLYSAGRLGKLQAGHYTIDGGNIAGRCIRLFDISQAGWYATTISNLFAESLASLGTIFTQVPTSINNCTFHFIPPAVIGRQTLLHSNSSRLQFNSCTIRYYGFTDKMRFAGAPTFNNCLLSGEVVKQ
jgi:hypothetical protein